MKVKYAIKTDDLLLKLLNDYHNVDASEALTFFGERVKEMLECEPNITTQMRRNILVSGSDKTDYVASKTGGNRQFVTENKVYVLRGYYPNTHLPFKMTLVKFNDFDEARAKVIMGLKEHHTTIYNTSVDDYQDAVSESILLSSDTDPETKVKYEYRKFKLMRPRGIDLYHEKK